MRALILGAGSIGRRHFDNLGRLGVAERAFVDPNTQVPDALCLPGLEEGLAWGPDLVVVASPTHLHASQTLRVLPTGLALFVEKPLTHTPESLHELEALSHARTMVACNMRYHPGLRAIHQRLSDLGQIFFARFHFGFDLRRWRPHLDYRQSYSAQASQGGGIILDCIHEIDLARWLLGEVVEVTAVAERAGRLEIDVEDVASMTLRHGSGVLSHLHLDYLQPTYQRGCQLVGERGALVWDWNRPGLEVHRETGQEWIELPTDWEPNQMYLDQFRDFLECLEHGRPTPQTLRQGAAVVRVALAAKAAAESGCRTRV